MLTLYRGCDLIYLTMDKLGQLLAAYLQTNNTSDRNAHLNLTKMILFLSIGLIKSIDSLTDDNSSSKKIGQKNNRQSDINLGEWDDKRFKSLVQIYNIIQLPLEKLWNESIAEEIFVKYVFFF